MKKVRTKIVMLLVVIGLMNTLCASVFATESGSITVQTLENKDIEKPILGVQVTLYHIAEVSDNSSDYYIKTTEFSGFPGNLTWNNADDCAKLAGQLYDYTKAKDIKGVTMVTAQDGKAIFENLDRGLYLVVQSGKKLEKYKTFIPGLVEVPLYKDSKYEYQVKMFPKIEGESTPVPTKSPTPTPSTPPTHKPDPYGMNQWPVPVLAVSGCFCLIVGATVLLLSGKKEKK